MISKNYKELDEAIKQKLPPYLYNGGKGEWIHCAQIACIRNSIRPPSKQFPFIRELPDPTTFKYGGSELLAKLLEGQSYETHPHLYTQHCWDVENRGCVGETVFHVCFLQGTTIHLHLAKRLLMHFPLLLNDIYLSDEYYGENVLHMSCVAEDPSVVKWLLDIGADFNRRCYGNFFTCHDQQPFRTDSLEMEEVVLRDQTDYYGYVAWGEYSHCFAAVLNQEECYRLILAKGGNPDMQDINGCTVTHILVVYDNMKMFDMAVECGAAINIENKYGLTPLTMAAYLARMDMFFHIASIEREVYWQLGNITCSAYPLKYLDTIDSDTGELNTKSALHLIVFGPKIEHLDLIEAIVVDLLQVKWKTFVRREFFKQMIQFTVFFGLAITAFIIRPHIPEGECREEVEISNKTIESWTTDLQLPMNVTVAALTLLTNNATNATNSTCEMIKKDSFDNCYLHSFETTQDRIRFGCEATMVVLGFLYLLKAARELSYLGHRVFYETIKLCPSRVVFLISCALLQLSIPARMSCFYEYEDLVLIFVMLSNGLYFLFFCRGFKLVGPMVTMIYRMLAQDLTKFGIIYSMFIIGFSQAYYIIYQTFEDDEEEGNPMENPQESFIQMFIMSLGEFGDLYDTFESTRYSVLAKIQWFIFMSLLVILMLNLLIAMMGDTYAKIAEIKNEWMRQWARIVLIVERSISPKERLRQQNRYCDIDTQGNKALVMKQYLDDEKVEEIGEIIEMKFTHRKNLERRKAKFGLESVSDLGKNLACSTVIAPDASDGSPPED